MNIGIYPGSFDPITIGHLDIIEKAIQLCDEVHVVVAVNYDKKHMFSIQERTAIVKEAIKDIIVPFGKKIVVVQYEGIVSNYAKEIDANIMIRGIRNHVDLQYEQNIEQFTKQTAPNVNTIYFTAEPSHMFTSSSLIRQFIQSGEIEKIKHYITPRVIEPIFNIVQEQSDRFIKQYPEVYEVIYSQVSY